jgi:AP-3 complex subunit delta-1
VIAECKKELRDSDTFTKAQAIRKLTYLQMLGYDMSWAAFQVVEVMSQPRFAHKRIGYLAACQSFQQDTEVGGVGQPVRGCADCRVCVCR